MSGEKRTYVSVEEQELRRLREQESRLRTVNQDLPDRLNAIRQQAQREMQNRIAPMEARQQRQDKMVRGLQSDLARTERETHKRLNRYHREFTDGLQKQKGEILQIVKKQNRKFASKQEMQNRIAPIEARQKRQEEKVQWLQNGLSHLERNTQNRLDSQQREFTEGLNLQKMDYLHRFEEQDQKFASKQEMQNRIAPIEARQQRQEEVVSELRSDLSHLERNTHDRLEHQRREYTEGLNQQRGEYLELFEQQDRKFASKQEMQNRIAPIEARQQRQEEVVSELQSDLSHLERNTQNRFDSQHREFTNRLNQQKDEYNRLTEDLDWKFTDMIECERRERQQDVEDLQNQIGEIVADANRKQSAAAAFVSDLSKIMQESANLPHERFAPGQMESIQRHAEDARRSLNAGMPEACLSTAQNAYWDLADLRVLVLQKEREFMLIHQAAMEEARAILEEARANRQYQLEVGEGAEKDVFSLEVDHWTNGELSAYEKQIADREKILREGEKTLNADQVREILNELENMKPCLPEIVEHARQNILASQLRSNIAELAVSAFQREGFAVDDAAYQGNDERQAYVVKMKNRAGTEVVTVISPVQGEFGKNTVSVHSFDEGFTDENTLLQRSQEMVSALREQGLDAGQPQCAGHAKPEFRDMETVRQQGTRSRL